MREQLAEVALAILYQDGRFLMQLRDDVEYIVHPGIWGFFGGHIEPGEDAGVGVRRELLEEIAYAPPELTFYQEQADSRIRRFFYHGALTVPISELQLNEGQDLGLLSVEEITAGEKFSEKLGEMRSLGKPHQQALLNFIDSGIISL